LTAKSSGRRRINYVEQYDVGAAAVRFDLRWLFGIWRTPWENQQLWCGATRMCAKFAPGLLYVWACAMLFPVLLGGYALHKDC
jgi:hypothetical protein